MTASFGSQLRSLLASLKAGRQASHNVYALAAPHEVRWMRSSGVTPVKDHSTPGKSDLAFTAPLGFEQPMARAHVKLLGLCFCATLGSIQIALTDWGGVVTVKIYNTT